MHAAFSISTQRKSDDGLHSVRLLDWRAEFAPDAYRS